MSAVLVAASLPPWDLAPAIFVALVPWIETVCRRQTRVGAAWQGLWLATGIALLSTWWLAIAVHSFAGLSWGASIAALLAYALVAAQPQLILFALLVRSAVRGIPSARTHAGLAVVGGLAYVGVESIVPRLFDVGLGVALHDASTLRQLAEIGGIDVLTALVVAVNLLLWQALFGDTAADARRSALSRSGAFALALVLSGILYGAVRLARLEEQSSDSVRTLSVAMIQGSVPNERRIAWARGDEEAAAYQLDRYLSLTEPLVERRKDIDLVVWPEATFPGVFGQPTGARGEARANRFDRLVLRLDRPIVFGAYDLERRDDGDATLYNAIFAVEPDASTRRRGGVGRVQRYRKVHLLPLAESLPRPLERVGIRRLLPGLGTFGRGPGARLLPIERAPGDFVRLAPILCSESLFPDHAIDGARLGADVLLNVGSDGWFGDFGEPELHLAIAKLRSVETRLPQIRVANSGLSAVVLPSGATLGQTRLEEERRIEVEVPLATTGPTPFVRLGDWLGPVGLLVSAFVGAAHPIRRRRAA